MTYYLLGVVATALIFGFARHKTGWDYRDNIHNWDNQDWCELLILSLLWFIVVPYLIALYLKNYRGF